MRKFNLQTRHVIQHLKHSHIYIIILQYIFRVTHWMVLPCILFSQLEWCQYIKKGPKLDYTNYRPISVLPITSLILERHVNLHLKAYLELNSLFYFRQSGFRKHYSCQTALIKIIDDWLSAIMVSQLVILSAGMLILSSLLKSVILIYSYCRE